MRQPELPHRKTQTPIVAKQIEKDMGMLFTYTVREICVFTKFKKQYTAKKGIVCPKDKISPYIKIFDVFGSFIIAQFLRVVNIFIEVFGDYIIKNTAHLDRDMPYTLFN